MALAEAQELIELQALQIEALIPKLQGAELNLSRLQHQVEQLLRRVYGRRSEKMDPNQLLFDSFLLEADQSPASEPEPVVVPEPGPVAVRTRRNHPGRIPIPDPLERVEIVLDLPEEQKVFSQSDRPLKQIGWEISEKLEYRPGKLIVNVYKRPKYVAPDLEGPEVRMASLKVIFSIGFFRGLPGLCARRRLQRLRRAVPPSGGDRGRLLGPHPASF